MREMLYIGLMFSFLGFFILGTHSESEIDTYFQMGQTQDPADQIAPPFDTSQSNWYRDYLIELESFNSADPGDEPPYIYMAGYLDTEITFTNGGTLKMLAYVVDLDSEVTRVEIYYEGMPTGVFLLDDGNHSDYGANDGLWGFSAQIPPGSVPAGEYLLELRAFDSENNASDLWPYLTIHS